jgi:hypothetical protein
LPKPLLADSRIVSAFELLLGTLVVIGHNFFQIVPNEVPILFVLGLASYRLRNGGWSAMGLARPTSWGRVLKVAVAAATLRLVLGEYVADPLTSLWLPPAVVLEEAWEITATSDGVLGPAHRGPSRIRREIAYRGTCSTRRGPGQEVSGHLPGRHGLRVDLFGCGHF